MRYTLLALILTSFGLASTGMAATGTSTAKIPAPAVKNPWGFNWTSENVAIHPDPNESDADDWVSDNSLTLSYKVNNDFKIWTRQYFSFNYFQDDRATHGDFALGYNLNHGDIPGGVAVGSQARLYLPISEASKEIGQHQLRYYLNFSKAVSKSVSFKAETNPRFFGYTKHEEGQLALKWQNTLGVSWAPVDVLSFGLTLGHIHYGRNSGKKFEEKVAVINRNDPFDNDDAGLLDAEVNVNLTDNIGITFLAEQERDLRASDSFQLFATAETLYFLILSVSL